MPPRSCAQSATIAPVKCRMPPQSSDNLDASSTGAMWHHDFPSGDGLNCRPARFISARKKIAATVVVGECVQFGTCRVIGERYAKKNSTRLVVRTRRTNCAGRACAWPMSCQFTDRTSGDRHAGKPFTRGIREVVIIADAAAARIGEKARQNGVLNLVLEMWEPPVNPPASAERNSG